MQESIGQDLKKEKKKKESKQDIKMWIESEKWRWERT